MHQPATEVGISVVICAYADHRWPQLQEAVESVRGQSRPALETIVVIDHNPALLERARRELAGAAVIENQEPRGLSGARNSGLRIARGAVVAFLDDDAVAEPDWLTWLAAPYAEPQVLGVGGAIEPRWMSTRPAGFPAEFQWVQLRGHADATGARPQPDRRQHVDAPGGVRARRRLPDRDRAGRAGAARLRGDRAVHPGTPATAGRRVPLRAALARGAPGA
jgi:glycosyltransferase involved in cell wall biosynthesis